MYYSVDRFEGDTAVLIGDDENSFDVNFKMLPKDTKQGDILVLANGHWIYDPQETEKRHNYVLKLQKKLFNRNHKRTDDD